MASNACLPRLTAARMASADLVQTNRLGLVVGFSDEAVDGGLKLDNRGEDAAFEALPGERGKQAFDGIGPGAGSRGEVEGEARMARQPGGDPWVLMGGVVVEHHVDRFVGRHLTFDGIEKPDELLMPVALHTAPDDLALENVEGEQGWWCRCACNRGSSWRSAPSSSAGQAGCGRALGFGFSR